MNALLSLKMRRMFGATLCVLFLGAGISASEAADVVHDIASDGADNYIGLNTNGVAVLGWSGEDDMTMGTLNAAASRSNQCVVVMFPLPDPGSLLVSNANIAVDMECIWPGGTDPFPKGVDIYGVRYSNSSAVVVGDYGFNGSGTGTLIQEDVFEMPADAQYPYATYETDAGGDLALALWLAAQYNAGAQAGDFVFLRYELNGNTANKVYLASAEHATQSVPTLTVVLGTEGAVAPDPLPLPTGFTIISETSDTAVGVYSNGTVFVHVGDAGQPEINLGDNNADYGKADQCAIVMFELPDLEGTTISNANLSAFLRCSWPGGSDPFPKGVDLYGIRYAASASVVAADYGFKGSGSGALIQTNVFEMPSNAIYESAAYDTDATADATLAAWLTAQYADGAVAGNYVFFRYEPSGDTANQIYMASANNSDTNMVPTLTMDLEAPPSAKGAAWFVSAESISTDVLKIVFSSTGPPEGFLLLGCDDLVSGDWDYVSHSDSSENAFIETNLSYSTANGTNYEIYVEATNTAAFYGIE